MSVEKIPELKKFQGNKTFFDNPDIKLQELANKAHLPYLQQYSRQKARLLRIVQSSSTWDCPTFPPINKKPFDLMAKGLL